MSVETIENESTKSKDSSTPEKKSRFNWKDPSVPVGNAPPFPKWPLMLSATLWVGWTVFLFVMMIRDG